MSQSQSQSQSQEASDEALPMLRKLLAHVDPAALEEALSKKELELKRGPASSSSSSSAPPPHDKNPAKTLQLIQLQNTNLSNRVHLAEVEQGKARDDLQKTQAALESERERKAALQKQLQGTLEALQHGSWKRNLDTEIDDLRTDLAQFE